MAHSLPLYSSAFIKPHHKRNAALQAFQIKAQRFSDEGRWRGMVDENMSVLRERIEEVKRKERVEKCCECENGWNYGGGYNDKLKKKSEVSKLVQILGLSCGSFAFTCASGTLFLFIVSILVHSNH